MSYRSEFAQEPLNFLYLVKRAFSIGKHDDQHRASKSWDPENVDDENLSIEHHMHSDAFVTWCGNVSLTFSIPFRSVAEELNDFFCWKWPRRSSKLSSLSRSGCSNDTLDPFNDGFDIADDFFRFDSNGFSNVFIVLLLLVMLRLFKADISVSSVSRIGLNGTRVFCCWSAAVLVPPDKSVLSLALSITWFSIFLFKIWLENGTLFSSS